MHARCHITKPKPPARNGTLPLCPRSITSASDTLTYTSKPRISPTPTPRKPISEAPLPLARPFLSATTPSKQPINTP